MAEANVVTKHCYRCNTDKAVAEFYPDKRRRDGLRNTCKACVKAANAKFNRSPGGRAYRREKMRAYMATEAGRTTYTAYRRSAHFKELDRGYRTANAAKAKARRAVRTAVAQGLMPPAAARKCQHCDRQADQYHHHLGYAPEHHLSVHPVCRNCHGRLHRKDESEQSN